jgi:hypothetical protein
MSAPVTITNFKGEIPRLHPRLLPAGFARRAVNARLTSGRLDPFRRPQVVHVFDDDVTTIFRNGSTWLGFPGEAHVVRGPVAQDRIYWTTLGDTPKMLIAGTEYELALPAPIAAPALEALTTPDPALLNQIIFAYTFVTEFDEESAPSPVSAPLDWSPGVDVRVTGFSAPVASRGVNRIRLYRSQTSALGITDLYFVAEFPIATVTHDHDLAAEPLQEVIPSNDYDPPPAAMAGLTALHNGMLAAFSGRELFFCEPYKPHAWPIKYRLTTDFNIAGLAAFGSTLAVLTEGTPYILQGSAPENMVMERMDSNMPCISSRAIVDFGYAAAYPSNDGLALITPSGVSLASRNLFSQQDWRALRPASMVAVNYDGRYAFTYSGDVLPVINAGTALAPSDDILDGGTPDLTSSDFMIYNGGGVFEQTAFESLGFLDLTGEQPFFIATDNDVNIGPAALYHDDKTGDLFMVGGDLKEVWQFDAPTRPLARYGWCSNEMHFPGFTNFGAILIESDELGLGLGDLTVTVKAGEREFEFTPTLNEPQRLPGGFLERKWMVSVDGTIPVTLIAMAASISDFSQ